jgi:hypothetical protein
MAVWARRSPVVFHTTGNDRSNQCMGVIRRNIPGNYLSKNQEHCYTRLNRSALAPIEVQESGTALYTARSVTISND